MARLLKKSQKAQAVQYNRKRKETPAFKKRELTWLLPKYIETKRQSTKLDNKKLGPFKILEKVGTHARKLELPGTMRIHLVFHVSLLELFRGNPNDPEISHPNPIEVNGEEKYKVQKILDSRIGGRDERKKRQYLVKWERYPSSNNTWKDKINVKKSKSIRRLPFKEKSYC